MKEKDTKMKITISTSKSFCLPEFMEIENNFSPDHYGSEHASVSVMCKAVRQHIWNEAILVGVSEAGLKKLEKFTADHPRSEWSRFRTDFGQYCPNYQGTVSE